MFLKDHSDSFMTFNDLKGLKKEFSWNRSGVECLARKEKTKADCRYQFTGY